MSEPKTDFEKCEIVFPDSEFPMLYWWEDMRPKEIREDFLEIWRRGVEYGKAQSLADEEKP